MDVAALEGDFCDGGVEVLIFKFAYFSAIHGVSPVGAESFDIKLVCPLADFLVGVESHAYFPVLDFGMLLQVYHSRDDFGYAGFVVGPEEGRAVCHDEVLAQVIEQFRELRGGEYDVVCFVEGDVAPFICFHDTGVDVATRHVRGGVEVGDKSDCGYTLLVSVGGKGGHQVTVLIKRYFLKAELAQLFFEDLRERELPGGRGGEIGQFIALGVILDIS